MYLTIVQMVRNNAREEFRRRVLVAYGRAVLNALQIRFAVAAPVLRVVLTSTFGTMHVKIIIPQTADRTGTHVPRIMQGGVREEAGAGVFTRCSDNSHHGGDERQLD